LKSLFSIGDGFKAQGLLTQHLNRCDTLCHRAREPVAEVGRGLVLAGYFFDDTIHTWIGKYSVIQLGHPPRRIDLLTGIDGVAFADCWARRETLQADGLTLHLIALEDFKANKRAAGRLKDLADLQALEPDGHV